MSLREAARGLVFFLLSVLAVQGEDGWRFTYAPTQICTIKGSTVTIHCTFSHPSRINDHDVTVERTFWFTEVQNKEPEDLRTDSKYAGRVQNHCGESDCTLTITDLRESDSHVYEFMLITGQGGRFIGSPGVKLTVTGFSVLITKTSWCTYPSCTWSDVQCHTSCVLNNRPSYVWYINGQNKQRQNLHFTHNFYSEDSVSCAVKGFENSPSAPVCVHGNSCNRVNYRDRSICAFKGSSVDISVDYHSFYNPTSKFWFVAEPNDRWRYGNKAKIQEQVGRFQVLETAGGRSTLRISNLRESDSAHYRFIFDPYTWWTSLPGTTLTVKDPDLQVQVIWSPSGPTLTCHSSCLLSERSSFVWYKNGTKIQGETSPSFRGLLDPGDFYSCAYERHRSLPVYAPKVPSVLMSHPGDIFKDSSVTLTCSSDAYPPHTYAWNKENQKLGSEPHLVLSSIQSSDSGEYYCTAENELGKTSSKYVLINVKYAPQTSIVSVSPPGVIVEGRPVNLTCSSDSNPAATFTWYKESRTLFRGPEGVYRFSSISSGDGGVYRCKSENQYGQTNSTSLHLDVQYAPKPPSVSASPSAETVEGSSVNLTCSSDANPAANYTWYKENKDSPKASVQIFTIADIRAEHGGNYLCAAENRRGRRHATLRLTVVTGAWKSMVTGTILAVFLLFILLAVFLWSRHKSITQQSECSKRADGGAQLGPVSDQRPAAPAVLQDDLEYTSICFNQSQTDAVYSNIRWVHPPREREEDKEEEDGVEYSAVRFHSSATGTGSQEDVEHSSPLYSTVKLNYKSTM
ncbi:B-cell receptor CD22 isoform X2 [Scophthalmus maximus]|uniref:B-cell receptor CD22 isoform X2 n=1 Tax=Scophthalmus maximus TaxID=52904 RepID=UPI001FA88150|nr:B-cell receptor CD22 isoform X2 [Scophthalmus maximus]